MAYLIDSGALLAMLDRRDKYHQAAVDFIEVNKTAAFYLTPYFCAKRGHFYSLMQREQVSTPTINDRVTKFGHF